MWIAKQTIAAANQKLAAELAEVNGEAAMQGENEYRGVPLCAPWGIAYLPPNAAQAVVVSTRDGSVCVGALTQGKGLAAGELMLFSAGGAEIYLKNSGEVVINGQVFAKKEG